MIIALFFAVIIATTVSLSLFSGLSLWFIPLWLLSGIILAFLLVILSVVVGIPFSKVGRVNGKIKNFYVRQLSDFLKMILQIHTKTTGRENIPKTPFVVYANHKSNTDPFIIVSSIRKPMGFAAKSGVFKIPIVKHWLRSFGCININRDNDREAIKEILVGIKHVESGQCMAIFPEGGIKDRTTTFMHEVKPGAYKLATKPEVPILPVALIGNRHIMNNAPLRRTKVRVIILKPIMPEVYQTLSTVELGDYVKDVINEAIKKGNPN